MVRPEERRQGILGVICFQEIDRLRGMRLGALALLCVISSEDFSSMLPAKDTYGRYQTINT